jgi:hypothetical protein
MAAYRVCTIKLVGAEKYVTPSLVVFTSCEGSGVLGSIDAVSSAAAPARKAG